jgi:hypothetical protein
MCTYFQPFLGGDIVFLGTSSVESVELDIVRIYLEQIKTIMYYVKYKNVRNIISLQERLPQPALHH